MLECYVNMRVLLVAWLFGIYWEGGQILTSGAAGLRKQEFADLLGCFESVCFPSFLIQFSLFASRLSMSLNRSMATDAPPSSRHLAINCAEVVSIIASLQDALIRQPITCCYKGKTCSPPSDMLIDVHFCINEAGN